MEDKALYCKNGEVVLIIRDKTLSLQDWIRPDGDPSGLVENSLSNMVFEKAVEYHQSPTKFISM